jgi:hypothetical protein
VDGVAEQRHAASRPPVQPLDDRLRSLLPGALADRAVALRDHGTILFLAQVLFEQPADQVAERLWPGLGLTTSGDFLMWGIIGGKDQLRSDLELSAMPGAQLHRAALAAVADGHPVTRAIVESAERRAGAPSRWR